jgi:hypothetical protein
LNHVSSFLSFQERFEGDGDFLPQDDDSALRDGPRERVRIHMTRLAVRGWRLPVRLRPPLALVLLAVAAVSVVP